MSDYGNMYVAFKHNFWGDLKYFYVLSGKKGKYAMWFTLSPTIATCMVIDDELRRI